MRGKVLDVGGRKVRRRGAFIPPLENVDCWVTVNPDEAAFADVLGGLPKLPFHDGDFDVVICTEVLEYVQDVEAAVEDIARVLCRDGVAFVSVPFLHRLHGDSGGDRRRFTVHYLSTLFASYFADVKIEAMGGIFAVIFDLLWARALRRRYFRPIFRLVGRLSAARVEGSKEDCTGFFIVARKRVVPVSCSSVVATK